MPHSQFVEHIGIGRGLVCNGKLAQDKPFKHCLVISILLGIEFLHFFFNFQVQPLGQSFRLKLGFRLQVPCPIFLRDKFEQRLQGCLNNID